MAPITKPRAKTLSIGGLARRTGCNIETIRYYEKIGLLALPPRSDGGHRLYGPDQAKRLAFVRRARALGFTLEAVRELLSLADGGAPCAEVRAVTLTHLGEVRGKIADLARIEQVLAATVERCRGGKAPACPVLDALAG